MHRWRTGAPTGGHPNKAISEAPAIETTIGSPLQAIRSSLAIPGARLARLLDKLMLGLYFKPME